MSRRFKRKFFLQALTVGTKEVPGELPSFLNGICEAIISKSPITQFPPLSNFEFAWKVWAATGGNPDYIMALLKEAVLRALLNNRQDVQIEDLSTVWENGYLDEASQVVFNPFKAKQSQIMAAIRKSRA